MILRHGTNSYDITSYSITQLPHSVEYNMLNNIIMVHAQYAHVKQYSYRRELFQFDSQWISKMLPKAMYACVHF